MIQRCQWHKRENILSCLPQSEQAEVKRRLNKAHKEPDYELARQDLKSLHADLQKLNRAARSLQKGLEYTLTLQRLGMGELFGKCFSTTNSIESLNSAIGKYTRNVKRWGDSDQRYRWTCMAIITHEKRMRRVDNFKKLHLLKAVLKQEVERKRKETSESDRRISTKNET